MSAPLVALCWRGDGLALRALWNAVLEELPISFVVIDNAEFNRLKKLMKSKTHSASARIDRFIAMDLVDARLDFASLAAALGVPAHRVERSADIAPAIEAGIRSGGADPVSIVVRPT